MSHTSSRRRSIASWSFFLLAMACLFVPSLALAQSSGPYTVSSDDLSKKIFLDYLFGPLTGAGASPLTSVVKLFNSAILFLGGVFMAYTIIAGTMATAHDGEMLGKKWSSLWLPIRTTLGAAAVMPVIGGGWCAAQALVVWLATLGIGIANSMWGVYIQNGNMLGDAIYNPPAMSRQVHQTFENMLMSNVCVAAYQQDKGQALSDQPQTALLGLEDYSVFSQNYGGVQALAYGTQAQAGSNSPECGKISFPAVTAASTQPSGTGATGTGAGEWTSYTGRTLLNMPQVNSQILPVQNANIQGAQPTLYSLAVKIVTTGGDKGTQDAALQTEVSNTLAKLTKDYTTQVRSTAQNVYGSAVDQSFLTTMAQDGWLTAGAFYMEISRAQDQLTDAVTTVPTTTNSWSSTLQTAAEEGKQGWWSRTFGSTVPQLVIDSMGRTLKMTRISEVQSSGGVSSITDAENAQDGVMTGSWADRFVSAFTSSRTADGDDPNAPLFGGDEGTGLNQNPVIAAKNLGTQMLTWAWASLWTMVGIGMFTVGGAGVGAFTIAAGPFTMLFGTLLVGGATLAYYIPMLPYIMWVGVVLGWAVLLVEAVIAAPLWAVVHMAPDADGVVGRGGQGYMLVLSLTLRPALMILGLVAAISLMRPLGYLINSTFGGAFALSHSPGMAGLTAMIAGVAIYAGVMTSVINQVFSLIHVVPDRLLRWIGGGGNELGGSANAIEHGASGKMMAMTQAARGFGDQAQNMLASSRQVAEARKGREENRQNKLAQQDSNYGDRVSRADDSARNAMTAAERSSNMNGDTMDTARQYETALNESRTARAEALGGAVALAENTVARGGPDAAQAAEFLDRFRAAESKAKEQGPLAFNDFISQESKRASADMMKDPSNVQAYQTNIIKADQNQTRMSMAEARMTEATYVSQVKGTGGGSTPPPEDAPEGRGL